MEELNREELSLEKLDEQNFEDELHGTQEIRFAKQKKTVIKRFWV